MAATHSPGLASEPLNNSKITPSRKKPYARPPSHVQMSNLFSRCIPPNLTQNFLAAMSEKSVSVSKGAATHPRKYPPDQRVGRTPTPWLENAFQQVGLESRITPGTVNDIASYSHYGYVVECTLRRSVKKPRQDTSSQFSETVQPQVVQEKETNSSQDHHWRDWILILPHSGVFYSLISVSKSPTGLKSLPVSWLRLCRETGYPAKGGFASKFHSVWVISFPNVTRRLDAYHFDDYEDDMPFLPPDGFLDAKERSFAESRKEYRHLMEHTCDESNSFRKNCRRYIKGSYHHHLPSSCYLYDPKNDGDLSLHITCRDVDGSPREVTIVQARDLSSRTKNQVPECPA